MAKQPVDFYPETLLVTIENDQGKPYYVAHESAKDAMKANDLTPTIACIYKRDRRVGINVETRVEVLEETAYAKV